MNNDEGETSKVPVQGTAWKRRFFAIWSGQATSLFGSQLIQFALVWWLTMETGSAAVLATAAAMAYIPHILLGPIAGAIVDRWPRKKVMIVADSGIALATLVLIALFALSIVEPWHIFALLAVRSAGGSFHWPAMTAATSMMVPEEHLSRVGGLNQALQGLSGIVAPPVGAILIAFLPMQGVLSIDIITAVIAIIPLLALHIPEPVKGESKKGVRATYDDMKEGFRFLRRWPGALAVIGIVVMLNFLFAPVDALLPLLVTERFGGDAVDFATISAAVCAGILVGGLILAVWGGTKRRIVTAMVGLLVSGISVVAMGLCPPGGFVFATGAIFVAGLVISMANGSFSAIMQTVIPKTMQGRVFALTGSAAMSAAPLGLIVGAPISEAFGVHSMYVVSGVAMIALCAFALTMPSVLRFEELGKTAEPPSSVGSPAPSSPEDH